MAQRRRMKGRLTVGAAILDDAKATAGPFGEFVPKGGRNAGGWNPDPQGDYRDDGEEKQKPGHELATG